MRLVITISLAVLLAGCASSVHSARRLAEKPYDPSISTSSPGCIPVVVSFTGKEWMDGDEIKHKAEQRLRLAGHQLDDSYQCSINVDLVSRDVGCTVTFSKEFAHPIYFVDFDRAGKIQRVRNGTAVEGRGEKP